MLAILEEEGDMVCHTGLRGLRVLRVAASGLATL